MGNLQKNTVILQNQVKHKILETVWVCYENSHGLTGWSTVGGPQQPNLGALKTHIYLSIYLSTYLSIYLSIYPSICIYIYIFIFIPTVPNTMFVISCVLLKCMDMIGNGWDGCWFQPPPLWYDTAWSFQSQLKKQIHNFSETLWKTMNDFMIYSQ